MNTQEEFRADMTRFDKGDELSYSKEVYDIESIDNGKYLLDDGKYYTANKLKKVSEILEYNRNVEDNDEEEIHNRTQRSKRINRKLKQVGIDPNLILQNKRTRKRKNIFDI